MEGKILKKLRTEAGLTQKQLANKLGIAQNTIAMIETDKRKGNQDVTNSIATFFNVSLDYLEGRVNFKECNNDNHKVIDDFIDYLIEKNFITDPNDIDDKTSEMILNFVKMRAEFKLKEKGR